MTAFNLKKVPANDTQPKSIVCYDNKKSPVATIWVDGTVSINGQDLYLEEVKQLTVIAENFSLFFNNIQNEKEILTRIGF